MSERDAYEPGVPCWVSTMQPDPSAAADFYAHVFGWRFDSDQAYFIARLRDREVAGIAPVAPGMHPPPDPAWVTQVRVESPDETADRARSAGGTVVVEPFDGPNARMAVIADPAGGIIAVTRAGRHTTAEIVNEPGAWSMSSLQTPDVEGAAAFYASVFGWTTETFEMGESSITMFRVPGYVGGEPEQPVSREVVATMSSTEGDAPARWGLDFWVDDVDAVAARAEERGGSIVVAPFDMPLGRTAVLADVAGAVFSVTRVRGR